MDKIYYNKQHNTSLVVYSDKCHAKYLKGYECGKIMTILNDIYYIESYKNGEYELSIGKLREKGASNCLVIVTKYYNNYSNTYVLISEDISAIENTVNNLNILTDDEKREAINILYTTC